MMAVELESRVDRLEIVLEQFIRETRNGIAELNSALARMERNTERLERSLAQSIEQWERNRVQSNEQWERNRVQSNEQWERNLAQSNERLDRSLAESKKEHNKQWSELAQKMGTLVEDIVAPSLPRIVIEDLKLGEIVAFMPNVQRRHPVTRQGREFDVVIMGQDYVLLNETKSNAKQDYAKEFVDFARSGEFFVYFPEYKDKNLVLVFSSLKIPDNVLAYLTKEGVYAVAMGDETMRVMNLEAIREKK